VKGFEGIAHALKAEGIDTVFGLMAIDNLPLIAELKASGIHVVRARTEHGAISMADGYARATGKVGVVSVGDGPGAAFTANGLMTALRRRSPIILISGDTPASEIGSNLKHFDQAAFFTATAGHCLEVASGDTLASDLATVFQRAKSGIGPSVLNCPLNVFEDDLPPAWSYAPLEADEPATPDESLVQQAATLLSEAKRPLILIGRGALDDATLAEIERCASALGALVGTTLQAEGALRNNSGQVGIVGGLASVPTRDLVNTADVVLAVGAGLNAFTTDFGRLFSSAAVIRIARATSALDESVPVALRIEADTLATMRALNADLAARELAPRDSAVAPPHEPIKDVDAISKLPDVIDPRTFLDIFDRVTAGPRMVVTDAGHAMFFVLDRVPPQDGGERIWGGDFAAMTVGIPIGIGAAMGNHARRTFAFLGDGAFIMSPSELDTAAREGVPLTVIVMNDLAYGAEVHYLNNWGLEPDLALFPTTPDVEAVARALGCEAITVRDAESAERALERAMASTGPLVLDVRIAGDVRHRLWASAKRISGGR
jgi:acetolactate synthase-1/2/3 large subunit